MTLLDLTLSLTADACGSPAKKPKLSALERWHATNVVTAAASIPNRGIKIRLSTTFIVAPAIMMTICARS